MKQAENHIHEYVQEEVEEKDPNMNFAFLVVERETQDANSPNKEKRKLQSAQIAEEIEEEI